MNYTVQLHGERMVYPVPSGLYELMSDITREVLRDQPSMVYSYIAHYLETLVKVREYSRTACALVEDVIYEDQNILAFVDSVGVSYSEANIAARRIQGAFRKHHARKSLKSKIIAAKARLKGVTFSKSFQDYLDSLEVDVEEAVRASMVIQNAYRTYQSKKRLQERKLSKDASTHTIDAIALKYPHKKTHFKRDPKLLVFQQSPRHTTESTWSSLARDIAEEEGKWKPPIKKVSEPFVYERTEAVWEEKKKPQIGSTVSTSTNIPEDKISLPYYYDELQPKIPMVSESGLLLKEDSDIVTLFSTDSVDNEYKQKYPSQSDIELPTLSNLSTGPSKNKEMLAKELFGIIGSKTTSSKSLTRAPSQTANQSTRKATSPVVRGSLPALLRKSSGRTSGQGRPATSLNNVV